MPPTLGQMTGEAQSAQAIAWPAFERLPELREIATAEIGKAVVGCHRAIELMLIAAVSGGHVLLEGPPGTAKTLLSAATARVLGVGFRRVQFTPDLTPTDVLGQMTTKQGEPTFERGAVFTNVLLADEINRTPPRTQAALLEAMQERRVTVGGRSYFLDLPFFVIATQNPFEQVGIYPLPESQLDRFLFKIDLDYPGEQDELRMLELPHQGLSPDVLGEVQPILGEKRFMRVQAQIDATGVPHDVAQHLLAIVRRTRELPGVVLGASPRAAIHLLSAAKASARLAGRDTVSVADVRSMVSHVLSHRLILEGTTPAAVLGEALDSVAVPA
jgi:MoxR-like ATPase